jgi:hypothetical protein
MILTVIIYLNSNQFTLSSLYICKFQIYFSIRSIHTKLVTVVLNKNQIFKCVEWESNLVLNLVCFQYLNCYDCRSENGHAFLFATFYILVIRIF